MMVTNSTHSTAPALIAVVSEDGDEDLVSSLEACGVPGNVGTAVVTEVGTVQHPPVNITVDVEMRGDITTYRTVSQGSALETRATL